MTKRVVLTPLSALVFGGFVGITVVVACDSDNGDTSHGPDLGPLPTLDGGRKRLPDGAIVEADGAPVTDDDDDTTPGDDDDGATNPGTCSGGMAAIVAGSESALGAAVRTKGGAWKTAAIVGGGAKSKPALVALGTGFLGTTRGEGDKLQSFTFDGAAWSAATKIGIDGVKGPPNLAVAGAKAHVVYSAGPGTNTDYTHGIYDGANWDLANDKVGTGPGDYSFGGVSGGLAAIGDNVYFAQNGSDRKLYVRPYMGGWKAAAQLAGADTIGTADDVTTTPEIVAVKGKYDLVVIYRYKKDTPDAFNALAYATHEPGGNPEWGNTKTNYIDSALTAEKFAAVAINDTTIALTFRGDDGNAYYTVGTVGTDADKPVSWTAPAALGSAVDTAPSVAKGDCGDDALFAFATAGKVKTISLKGTTLGAPKDVPNLKGANVGIATRP